MALCKPGTIPHKNYNEAILGKPTTSRYNLRPLRVISLHGSTTVLTVLAFSAAIAEVRTMGLGMMMAHTRLRDFHLPLDLARLRVSVLARSLRPAACQGGLNPLWCGEIFLLGIVG